MSPLNLFYYNGLPPGVPAKEWNAGERIFETSPFSLRGPVEENS